MDTLAVVLQEPGASRAGPARPDAAGRGRRGRRHRLERHQHRHRAPAVVRPDAAVSRHGLSAGARLRIGRPRRARPAPQSGRRDRRDACSSPARSCFGDVRGLFGGAASRARRARRPRRRRSTRRWASRACCWRWPPPRCHAIAAPGASLPDLIVGHGVLGRLLARLAVQSGGAPPTVWETQPRARRRRRRLRRDRSGRRSAPRLPRDLRRQRRRRAARHLIGAPRAGRRDRAGRLLRRAAVASPSRRPSCARRASASPPNGSRPTSTRCCA